MNANLSSSYRFSGLLALAVIGFTALSPLTAEAAKAKAVKVPRICKTYENGSRIAMCKPYMRYVKKTTTRKTKLRLANIPGNTVRSKLSLNLVLAYISSPRAGAVLNSGSVQISAATLPASLPAGVFRGMEFYANGELVARSAVNAPFTAQWNATRAGTYILIGIAKSSNKKYLDIITLPTVVKVRSVVASATPTPVPQATSTPVPPAPTATPVPPATPTTAPTPTVTPTPVPQLEVLYDKLGSAATGWGWVGQGGYFSYVAPAVGEVYDVSTSFIGTLAQSKRIRSIKVAIQALNRFDNTEIPVDRIASSAQLAIWNESVGSFFESPTGGSLIRVALPAPDLGSTSVPVGQVAGRNVFVIGWSGLDLPMPANIPLEMSVQFYEQAALGDSAAILGSFIPGPNMRWASSAYPDTTIAQSLSFRIEVSD